MELGGIGGRGGDVGWGKRMIVFCLLVVDRLLKEKGGVRSWVCEGELGERWWYFLGIRFWVFFGVILI